MKNELTITDGFMFGTGFFLANLVLSLILGLISFLLLYFCNDNFRSIINTTTNENTKNYYYER
ncbi:MAG: hypothetical protein HFH46_00125 [Bacilli bacterium]|nr:hypothetical protein [Bacilli bacterium]MCI9586111.1 hypothetical protein [Bacilli bacterium]